jgi:hypothetical protein
VRPRNSSISRGLAAHHAGDHERQPRGIEPVRQVAARAGPHRREELLLLDPAREDDAENSGDPADDLGDRAESASGGIEVEQADVGPVAHGRRHGRLAVGRLRAHRVVLEGQPKTHPRRHVIRSDQHSRLLRRVDHHAQAAPATTIRECESSWQTITS